MYIGNNYMVSTKLANGMWHNEYFIDENSAREYANTCYKRGDMIIELLKRQRVGYNTVKRIVRKSKNSPLYEVR